MSRVTLQLVEGLERGSLFRDLAPPVTIGREDENSVRLNDERVSRFHAKIQVDSGEAILTDLESTNGTRVNGHPVQMRVLQIGDQISIGRCLLIYGSPEAISARADAMHKDGKLKAPSTDTGELLNPGGNPDDDGTSFAGGLSSGDSPHASDEMHVELFPDGPPDPPRDLRPLQRAQVSDFLGYCHEQIRRILQHAVEEERSDSPSMRVSWEEWQRLLRLEMDSAISMKKVADPDS